MAIDFGTAQVDIALFNALLAEGVREPDAKELARLDAFGGSSPSTWIQGLRTVATLLNHQDLPEDQDLSAPPWSLISAAIGSADTTDLNQIIMQTISTYSLQVQTSLVAAIGAAASKQEEHKVAPAPIPPASQHNSTATAVDQPIAQYLVPVNQDLAKQIQGILDKKVTPTKRRKQAGEHLIDWLAENGKFVRSSMGPKYYLYHKSRKLYTFDSQAWFAFIYLLTGSNPASTDFRFFMADCETAAESGERLDVVKVSHWDTEQQLLRISRFDGHVYRLDGMTVEEESNGDGPILFDDPAHWIPYNPDYSAKGDVLDWSLHLPQCTVDEGFYLLYRAWWLATFFTELCPTRPILVLKGEKGSGKTMSLRVLLRLLFGSQADVSGLPDKVDGFVAITSNNHIVVIDNLDTLARELRDKIASLSTGKIDNVRRLYTTNELHAITYRCWLAITSRSPDTLQRDDLADRTIILPLERLEDETRARETLFIKKVTTNRNLWWGDVLTALNAIIAELRRSPLPTHGNFRMEDWAVLGQVISRVVKKEDTWHSTIERAKNQQTDFLLEDNIIVQAVKAWLQSRQYVPAAVTTRHLYDNAKLALFGVDRPDDTWPRSVKSFGRQLKALQRELQKHLADEGFQMKTRILHGEIVYEFLQSA